MSIAKNEQIFFGFRKPTRSSKYNKKLIVDDKEIADQTHILECIREFYETLFKKRKQKTAAETKSFLRHLNILKSMQNNKSPGNDGLTKEFYETFWNELKEIFVDIFGKNFTKRSGVLCY